MKKKRTSRIGPVKPKKKGEVYYKVNKEKKPPHNSDMQQSSFTLK